MPVRPASSPRASGLGLNESRSAASTTRCRVRVLDLVASVERLGGGRHGDAGEARDVGERHGAGLFGAGHRDHLLVGDCSFVIEL